ncbi:hypothetical protein BROUX41_004490 [Berkeleyomyces rouxiae]|uniref:uncharacterized protein n=1 Tax=Berkeleyomyces rouxiae TaxID=2035830 RepID=UPI003B79D95C
MPPAIDTHTSGKLELPVRTGQADPGAHDLGESSADESEDHFSDAVSDMNSPGPVLLADAKTNPETNDPSTSKTSGHTADAANETDSSETIDAKITVEPEAEPDEETIVETKAEIEVEAADDEADDTDSVNSRDQSETKSEVEPQETPKGKIEDGLENKSEDESDPQPVNESTEDAPKSAVETSNDNHQGTDEPVDDESTTSDLEQSPDIALPGSMPIPTTILEESAGPMPQKSFHVEHIHSTDAAPDIVIKLDEDIDQDIAGPQPVIQELESKPEQETAQLKPEEGNNDSATTNSLVLGGDDDFDDDFGDFDDFEEGGDDDGFGEFDDAAFQNPVAAPVAQQPVAPAQSVPVTPALPFPVPDFEGLDEDDIPEALDQYMNILFPPENLDVIELPPPNKENTSFLTQRSASLWSQLVAPPPLAPPDWIRSRIRRLFLVSLGVPVDLDEILPASKQKKLVLPSLQVPSSKSPRTSTDSRSKKTSDNGTQVNSSSKSGGVSRNNSTRRRKGDKGPPELDLVSAKQLCMTTEEALGGMTHTELKAHLKRLKALQATAEQAIEYWQKTTDEKISERDALEGVIENLVKHARKVRK